MRVLFCGGGTAGHITPALALAEEFERRYTDAEIAFVGRENGDENKLINLEKYKLYKIYARGFSRNLSVNNLKTLKTFFDAKRDAKKILSDFNPDVVIGTGGYVSAPVITAAAKLGIFTLIHESNAALGFTTRMLAGKCDLLLLGADIKTRFKNAKFVGNPTLNKFGALSKSSARRALGIPMDKKVILSVGGSIGAAKLNEAVIEFMKSFSLKNTDVYHIHGSGKRYYDELRTSYPELCRENESVKILPFIDNMAFYLSAADILICRCGAMTLAEAVRAGCPTVMIPSPNVTGDHQRKNAIFYKAAGTGIVLEESDLTPLTLESTVKRMLKDKESLRKMSDCAKNFYKEDPKKQIVDLIESRLA